MQGAAAGKGDIWAARLRTGETLHSLQAPLAVVRNSRAVDDRSFERQHHAVTALRARQLFFVVGVPKSGTTWVQKVLDAHPAVECRGEAHLSSVLLPLLAGALRDYNRRADGRQRILARIGLDEQTPRFGHDELDFLFGSASALLLSKWMDGSTARCLGEKTPHSVLDMDRLSRIFPTARFLHVIRDGRDAAVSGWKMAVAAQDRNVLDNHRDFAAYARSFGRTWSDWIARARRFGSTRPQRYIEVRYEDLVGAPERCMRAMYDFLGVSTTPETLARAREATDFRTLSGGRCRGDASDRSFFRKGVAGEWVHAMSPAEHAAFAETGQEMLATLGYVDCAPEADGPRGPSESG